MSANARSSYEEIPYEGSAHFLTYPDHLAALARLFEVSAPEVETCRVLELGCARGDNLIPMAFSLPRARFTGVDLSPRQIAFGQATIDALGLENIELREQNIMDLGKELGTFDFILAHGVYSWVPDAVREKIMCFCGESLAPNGLVLISYNTHPGWHMRAMARHMMMFRARGIAGTGDQVRAGRTFMRELAHLLAKHDSPYPRCLRTEAEQIVRHDETYLAHEYLEETNEPTYFYQLVDRAASHGLSYLTDAQYWTTATARPAELFRAFGYADDDWLHREQIHDFITGRAFRHSVFCRDGTHCSRMPSAQAFMSLRISSIVRPVQADAAPGAEGKEDFENLRGESVLSTNDTVIRTVLRILSDVRPRSMPFELLSARVQERLNSMPDLLDRRLVTAVGTLADGLLDLYTHNLLQVHVCESHFTTEINEFPRASPVARREAALRPRVANLLHRMVALIDFDQLVLSHLDGGRDRRALLAKMQDAVNHGGFKISSNGLPITDTANAEPLLVHLLDESLRRLAAGALLIG
jgi:SAM-dependent methyltransferase